MDRAQERLGLRPLHPRLPERSDQVAVSLGIGAIRLGLDALCLLALLPLPMLRDLKQPPISLGAEGGGFGVGPSLIGCLAAAGPRLGLGLDERLDVQIAGERTCQQRGGRVDLGLLRLGLVATSRLLSRGRLGRCPGIRRARSAEQPGEVLRGALALVMLAGASDALGLLPMSSRARVRQTEQAMKP